MSSVLVIASLIGNIAFAFSGFLVGVRHRLDWMGVFIVSFLTASGGGIIRDVLIGKTPAVLLSNMPIYVVGGVMAGSLLLKLHDFPDVERRGWFVTSDAVGLVAFAVTGSLAGIDAGITPVWRGRVVAHHGGRRWSPARYTGWQPTTNFARGLLR